MRVLLDLSRLIARSAAPAPTGIDRVELAYAGRYLAGRSDSDAVAITPVGTFIVPRARASRMIRRLEARWSGGERASPHPQFVRLRRWLSEEPAERSAAEHGDGPERPSSSLNRLLQALLPGSRISAGAEQGRAAYLHVSHLRLDQPGSFAWLERRPDIRPVFFVHDLIPLDFPEHCRPSQVERHRVRLETVARRGSAIVVSSRHVAERVTRHLVAQELPAVPTVVAPIGLDDAFSVETGPIDAARPYFVVCGTIEARKNHIFLLETWRELAARLGPATPALVVVGSRGWGHEAVIDFMARCEALRPHVFEARGLPTTHVRAVIAGARALLMPSFAEGYGLPVIEALSLGTRVIASDLASHREIADGRATLLDPLDGPGWRAAIAEATGRSGRPAFEPPYVAPTWAAHFRTVDALLERL